MKNLAVLALLYGTKAVRLNKNEEKQLGDLVKAAKEDAQNLAKKSEQKPSQEALLAKDAEMKKAEGALAQQVVATLGYPAVLPPYYGYPYYGPMVGYPYAYYPYSQDVADAVEAVETLNRAIIQYEYENAIAAMVAPHVDYVNKILEAGAKNAPPAASLLETEEQGPAVLVHPESMLMEDVNQSGAATMTIFPTGTLVIGPDEVSAVQLDEKEQGPAVLVHPESMLLPDVTQSGSASMVIFPTGSLTIGADDVYAVQTNEENMDDTTVLQVNGVPVLVHPESMLLPDVTQSGSGSMQIFPTGTLEIGADDVSVVQTKIENPEDNIVLQVNGVPVLVHPESMLLPDVTQSGTGSMQIFPTGSLTIGADDVSVVQTKNEGDDEDDSVVLQVNGVPVTVNPESMLLTNQMAQGRIFPQGQLTLGVDDVSVAQKISKPDDSVVLQVKGVPVEVNPESMLLPNEMAASRIFPQGSLTLGVDDVSVAQKEQK